MKNKHIHHHSVQKLLILILSIIFLLSASFKLSGKASMVELFELFGLEQFRIAFGLIQLIIVACIWWRPTRNLGTVLAAAYLGSTIGLMISVDLSPLSAILALLLTLAINKINFWSSWKHGYYCGCNWCQEHHGKKIKGQRCDCGKVTCRCEQGLCDC